jgi:hypothetical protein
MAYSQAIRAISWCLFKKQTTYEGHLRHLGRWFPNIFLLREKSRNNPMLSPVMAAVHYIATKITKQKALRQAAQLPLNHHTPDLHTVALGLRTVVFSQWPCRPLIMTNSGQSTVLLDSLCSGLWPRTHLSKKPTITINVRSICNPPIDQPSELIAPHT